MLKHRPFSTKTIRGNYSSLEFSLCNESYISLSVPFPSFRPSSGPRVFSKEVIFDWIFFSLLTELRTCSLSMIPISILHARGRGWTRKHQMSYTLFIFLSRSFIASFIGALSWRMKRVVCCFLIWGLILIVTIHRNVDGDE